MTTSVDPLLTFIKPGWVGVEIGVAQGHSAKRLLDHGVRFLYLVDPWCKYEGYLESVGASEDYFEAMYRECYRDVISQYPGRHAVLRMKSEEAKRFIPGVDFAFLDGNHQFEYVLHDLSFCWPKVRHLICGHDYCNSGDTCEVKDAVDQFAGRRGLTVETYLDCWMIKV